MSGLGFVLLVFGTALLSFGAEGVGEERIRARMERRPPQTGGWYAVAFIGGVLVSAVAHAAARGAL